MEIINRYLRNHQINQLLRKRLKLERILGAMERSYQREQEFYTEQYKDMTMAIIVEETRMEPRIDIQRAITERSLFAGRWSMLFNNSRSCMERVKRDIAEINFRIKELKE